MSSSKLALDSLLKQQKSDAYADVISGVLEKAHWNTPANDKQHRIQQLTTFTSQGNKDTLNNASRYQDFWVDNPKRTFFRLANWASGMGNLCRILTKYDLEACKTLFVHTPMFLKRSGGNGTPSSKSLPATTCFMATWATMKPTNPSFSSATHANIRRIWKRISLLTQKRLKTGQPTLASATLISSPSRTRVLSTHFGTRCIRSVRTECGCLTTRGLSITLTATS